LTEIAPGERRDVLEFLQQRGLAAFGGHRQFSF
jgi:hypothetical protein